MQKIIKWLQVSVTGFLLAAGSCNVAETVEGNLVLELELIDSIIYISLDLEP